MIARVRGANGRNQRMGERRGEADGPRLFVDRRRLNGRDLVAAERRVEIVFAGNALEGE